MNANIEGIEDNYTPLIIKPSVIKGINYKMEVARCTSEKCHLIRKSIF